MRIITGRARGTKLFTLEGDNTRPTSERAKEALFSMLGDAVYGRRVLDLFAGSGQLGLEALSRGAAEAVFVEADRAAADVVRKNIVKTHSEECAKLCVGRAEHIVPRLKGHGFDLIFLDPPYSAVLLPSVLSELLRCNVVATDAFIICESASENDVFGGDAALAERFEIYKKAAYGAARITILKPKEGKR